MLEAVEKKSQALVPVEATTPTNALVPLDMPMLEQSQREAIVDLLLLGMYADQKITMTEQDVLAAEVEKMGWDEWHSYSCYFQRIVPTVREAMITQERTQQLLVSISQRLDNVDVMKFAIEKFSALLCLDGSNEAEAKLLDQVMETFFVAV